MNPHANDKLCAICHKNVPVFYAVAGPDPSDVKHGVGICLECGYKMHNPGILSMMKVMHITPEDLPNLQQAVNAMGTLGEDVDLGMLQSMGIRMENTEEAMQLVNEGLADGMDIKEVLSDLVDKNLIQEMNLPWQDDKKEEASDQRADDAVASTESARSEDDTDISFHDDDKILSFDDHIAPIPLDAYEHWEEDADDSDDSDDADDVDDADDQDEADIDVDEAGDHEEDDSPFSGRDDDDDDDDESEDEDDPLDEWALKILDDDDDDQDEDGREDGPHIHARRLPPWFGELIDKDSFEDSEEDPLTFIREHFGRRPERPRKRHKKPSLSAFENIDFKDPGAFDSFLDEVTGVDETGKSVKKKQEPRDRSSRLFPSDAELQLTFEEEPSDETDDMLGAPRIIVLGDTDKALPQYVQDEMKKIISSIRHSMVAHPDLPQNEWMKFLRKILSTSFPGVPIEVSMETMSLGEDGKLHQDASAEKEIPEPPRELSGSQEKSGNREVLGLREILQSSELSESREEPETHEAASQSQEEVTTQLILLSDQGDQKGSSPDREAHSDHQDPKPDESEKISANQGDQVDDSEKRSADQSDQSNQSNQNNQANQDNQVGERAGDPGKDPAAQGAPLPRSEESSQVGNSQDKASQEKLSQDTASQEKVSQDRSAHILSQKDEDRLKVYLTSQRDRVARFYQNDPEELAGSSPRGRRRRGKRQEALPETVRPDLQNIQNFLADLLSKLDLEDATASQLNKKNEDVDTNLSTFFDLESPAPSEALPVEDIPNLVPFHPDQKMDDRQRKDQKEEADKASSKDTEKQIWKNLEKKEIEKHLKARPKQKPGMLDQYSTNLTEKARKNQLKPLIGRQRELKRVIQILNRRDKNNPAIIGEPGVGKTALAEGLASAIVANKVPASMLDKEVLELDLTAVVAGTQYRGQFEQRMKNILKEAEERGNVILVIDEMHSVLGAGDSEGSLNAANILKPALSQGNIRFIGCTTLSEYSKQVEEDPAFERRFQKVIIEEPTDEQTLQILKGLREIYSDYHYVTYSDEVLQKAVQLTKRYVPERFQPDKALDLIDEVGATYNQDNPEFLYTATQVRKLALMRVEFARLCKLMQAFDNEEEELLETLHEKASVVRHDLYTKYNVDPDQADGKIFDDHLEQILDSQLFQPVQEESTKKRLAFRQRLAYLGNIIEDQEKLLDTLPEAYRQKGEIRLENMAEVVETWTGIPVQNIRESESEKLRNLESRIHELLIGQEDAVKSVSSALRRKRTGFGRADKPSSFLFVGPTGVGKTQLAKVLCMELFGDEKNIIRLDMSEYMEAASISKMIGSPPGYIGFENKGQLTEKVKNKPYSLVLLDEVEKAHPDVMNILLQLLDEGRLTDSHGRVVDFSHTIIIMTSNAGTSFKANSIGFENDSSQSLKNKVMTALKDTFRAEFLNRIDDIVVFNELTLSELKQIVQLLLKDALNELKVLGCDFAIDEAVYAYLVYKYHDEKLGARPMQRGIAQEVEDELANLYLEGRIYEGQSIHISVGPDPVELELTDTLKLSDLKKQFEGKKICFTLANDKLQPLL